MCPGSDLEPNVASLFDPFRIIYLLYSKRVSSVLWLFSGQVLFESLFMRNPLSIGQVFNL